MKFITYFIIFAVFYQIVDYPIVKFDIYNRCFNQVKNYKYGRVILICMLILFTFLFEYGKQVLNDKYGQHNYFALIVGAFLCAIYFNFFPAIFRKNK